MRATTLYGRALPWAGFVGWPDARIPTRPQGSGSTSGRAQAIPPMPLATTLSLWRQLPCTDDSLGPEAGASH